jgi:hypothetical protein
MNHYHQTIKTLFDLLAQANLADSDSDDKQQWQRSWDARQSNYFGHVASSIVWIAGQEIYDHWCDCNEIDFTLASRNN